MCSALNDKLCLLFSYADILLRAESNAWLVENKPGSIGKEVRVTQ
jgi:hypothetical protein